MTRRGYFPAGKLTGSPWRGALFRLLRWSPAQLLLFLSHTGGLEGSVRYFLDSQIGVVIDAQVTAERVVQRDDERKDQTDRQHGQPGYGDVNFVTARSEQVNVHGNQPQAEDQHLPDGIGTMGIGRQQSSPARAEQFIDDVH